MDHSVKITFVSGYRIKIKDTTALTVYRKNPEAELGLEIIFKGYLNNIADANAFYLKVAGLLAEGDWFTVNTDTLGTMFSTTTILHLEYR